PGDGAGGSRLADGRGDLRGVQGHRQPGAAPGPPPGGAARLAGAGRRQVRPAARGAAAAGGGPAPAVAAAEGAERPQAGGGAGAAYQPAEAGVVERRVPEGTGPVTGLTAPPAQGSVPACPTRSGVIPFL